MAHLQVEQGPGGGQLIAAAHLLSSLTLGSNFFGIMPGSSLPSPSCPAIMPEIEKRELISIWSVSLWIRLYFCPRENPAGKALDGLNEGPYWTRSASKSKSSHILALVTLSSIGVWYLG